MPTKIQVPTGITIKDHYFNHVPGVSNSDLAEVMRQMNGDLDFVFPQNAARIGNQVDALLTNMEEADFDMDHAEMLHCMKMAKNAASQPLVKKIIELGESQVIYTNHVTITLNEIEKTILMRAMYDALLLRFKVGADFKTTAETSQQGFERAIVRYDYLRQAWVYMEICGLNTFIFIGIPKKRLNEVYFKVIRRGDDNWLLGKELAETPIYYSDLITL